MNEELKIVIADDNIILANFIKDYIEKNSNFIIYKLVNSSEQEIELLNNEKIDIIITDIIRNKEEISGLDIIQKAEKENRQEKFILLTASSKQEIEYLTNYKLPQNITGYLKKPFSDWNEIIHIIENTIMMIKEQTIKENNCEGRRKNIFNLIKTKFKISHKNINKKRFN